MKMYEFKTAVRWNNGEVEGFRGIGFTKESAEQNANTRIANKLKMINELKSIPESFPHKLNSFNGMTKEEKESIQADWTTNFADI